jgi:hypothetical protein
MPGFPQRFRKIAAEDSETRATDESTITRDRRGRPVVRRVRGGDHKPSSSLGRSIRAYPEAAGDARIRARSRAGSSSMPGQRPPASHDVRRRIRLSQTGKNGLPALAGGRPTGPACDLARETAGSPGSLAMGPIRADYAPTLTSANESSSRCAATENRIRSRGEPICSFAIRRCFRCSTARALNSSCAAIDLIDLP